MIFLNLKPHIETVIHDKAQVQRKEQYEVPIYVSLSFRVVLVVPDSKCVGSQFLCNFFKVDQALFSNKGTTNECAPGEHIKIRV